MKKFFLTLMALLTIAASASAQRKMNVKLFDGTVYKLRTTDIEEIQFEDDDPNDPKVPYTHAVDLGLSVKWADMNVGAERPEDYGWYLAWGETEEKDVYNKSSYSESYYEKYSRSRKTTLDYEDDAAAVNWGGGWRMPTKAEQDELRSKCSWTWTTQNGVYGRKVTGPNGNSIFLPAAGYRFDSSLYDAGSYGYYWSSSLYVSYLDFVSYIDFNSSSVDWSFGYHYDGHSVRPVCSE